MKHAVRVTGEYIKDLFLSGVDGEYFKPPKIKPNRFQ